MRFVCVVQGVARWRTFVLNSPRQVLSPRPIESTPPSFIAATVTVDPASPTKACTMLGQRVRCVWCNGLIVMEVVHRHHREPQAVEVCDGCGGDDSNDDGACLH